MAKKGILTPESSTPIPDALPGAQKAPFSEDLLVSLGSASGRGCQRHFGLRSSAVVLQGPMVRRFGRFEIYGVGLGVRRLRI